MIKFDKNMKFILKYCYEVINIPFTGPMEVQRLVERSILSKDANPSPLLKYYNVAISFSNFDVIKRPLLELD